MSLLGIDLGGTKLAVTRFSIHGTVIDKQRLSLDGRVGKAVGALIANCLSSAINPSSDDPVSGIGISVPGINRTKTGTVWAPNIAGWDDYPLLHEMQSASNGVPVTIDSDRACSILGEIWQGKAAGCTNAIFLTVGTGIGAGIMSDGKILEGSNGISGAIGWMALNQPYADDYTNFGCFEYVASGDGIARTARALLQRPEGYRGKLTEIPVEQISSHHVFQAFEQDDPLAAEVFQICIRYWGMAVANLVSIFNPEKIIFGGGVFGPAVRFIPAIKQEALKWAQPISMQQVSLEPSALGPDAAVYGAAYKALQKISSTRNG